MDKKKKEVELLKAIDDFLAEVDEELIAKSDGEDEGGEVTEKAKKKDDEELTDEEKDKVKEKFGKKCAKGDAEGGGDAIGKKKELKSEEPSKKSFSDPEYEEYMELKKAKENEEKEALKKSITDLTELVGGLREKIETLSKRPVSTPKSVDGLSVLEKAAAPAEGSQVAPGSELETIAKSFEGMNPILRKAKIADVLFEKGVREKKLSVEDVAEYEHSGNMQDPRKRTLVKSLLVQAYKDGLL